MKNRVCCVVVTYNRKKLLKECIDAILSQSVYVENIFIVDNNSTDNTEDMIKEERYLDKENISYVKLEKNIGGAGGFAYGIKNCNFEKYDWIWIMDDDTIPDENALEKLLEGRNKLEEENVSFLASKVVGMNNEPMNVPGISQKSDKNGYRTWMKYLDKGIVELERATFVSILVNCKAIKEVSIPWDKFFIWGDDTEYTLRLTTKYGPGYAIGDSKVVHKRIGGDNISIVNESNINRINLYKYKYRNDIIIAKNYYSTKTIISICIRALKDSFKSIKSNEYPVYKTKIICSSVLNGLLNFKLNKSFKNI